MTIAVEALLERARDEGPACKANELIARAREHVEHSLGVAALSYEVVLPEGDDERMTRYLCETVAPRLTAHLRSKRLDVSACRGAFLSLFCGETLYFIGAPEFFEWLEQRP